MGSEWLGTARSQERSCAQSRWWSRKETAPKAAGAQERRRARNETVPNAAGGKKNEAVSNAAGGEGEKNLCPMQLAADCRENLCPYL